MGGPRPVLVSIGGASGVDSETLSTIQSLLTEGLVPLLDGWRVLVVDGGTDSGVMRAMGRARAARGARFPLIGVAAEGTLRAPNDLQPGRDLALLEPNHTHLVLVPGESWGDESEWLCDVSSAISGDSPSVTLLMNGGEISYKDAARSLAVGRPLIVLGGSGRAADAIAEAVWVNSDNPRARAIANSPLTRVVPLTNHKAVLDAVAEALTPPWVNGTPPRRGRALVGLGPALLALIERRY